MSKTTNNLPTASLAANRLKGAVDLKSLSRPDSRNDNLVLNGRNNLESTLNRASNSDSNNDSNSDSNSGLNRGPNNRPSNLNNLESLNNLDGLKRQSKRRKKNEDTETIYQNRASASFEASATNLEEPIDWPTMSHQSNKNSNKKWFTSHQNNEKWSDDKLAAPDELDRPANSILYLHSQRSGEKAAPFRRLRKRLNDEEGEDEIPMDAENEESTTVPTSTTTRKPSKGKQRPSDCEGLVNCNESATEKPTKTKSKSQRPYKSAANKSNRLKSSRIKMSTTPIPDFIPDSMFENNLIEQKLPHRSTMPFFAKFLIFLVMFTFIASIFYLCLRRWVKKFWRGSQDRTRASGLVMTAGNKLDMKNVQLLGQAYKEKVSEIGFCLLGLFRLTLMKFMVVAV